MIHTPLEGYERDIRDQPDALEFSARKAMPASVTAIDFSSFDRVIMTGMGSSDSVTIPLELVLARKGLPVWRIQTGRLLETLEMITERTLLWITSQSGRSGEVVALLERLPRGRRCTVVGMTNDPSSPLATGADHLVELFSGSEATVSSKSFLNSLAWLHRVAARHQGRSDEAAVSEILETANGLRALIAEPPRAIAEVAKRTLASPNPRLALVGTGADAATALTGALILKEASKVAAEGYVGGEFRHGPMELAGAGTTVLLFGTGSDNDITLKLLARDLAATDSLVVSVAPAAYPNVEHVAVSGHSTFARLAQAICVVQNLSVHLARQAGFAPGVFRFGQKITASL